MVLTKELYEYIDEECERFKERTTPYHDVDVHDVIYSYLFSKGDDFHILNDWDEGKANDPYWNDELNEHSVIVFLKRMCGEIDLIEEDLWVE